jgi:hypothetical protein
MICCCFACFGSQVVQESEERATLATTCAFEVLELNLTIPSQREREIKRREREIAIHLQSMSGVPRLAFCSL